MRKIESKKHKIGTCKIDKILLYHFDDKRFVLNDGIHTLAYLYKDIDSYRWSKIRRNSHKWEKSSKIFS